MALLDVSTCLNSINIKVAILTIVLRDQLSPGLAALAITYIMMIGDSTRSLVISSFFSFPLSFPTDRFFYHDQLDIEEDV